MMTRHQSRQEAFCLLFEKSFSDMTLEEIIEGATETRDLQPNEFTMQLAQGTVDHVEELDALIEPKLKNWKLSRISKVSLAILRMAAYELMYVPQVPINVTVDEAVELASSMQARMNIHSSTGARRCYPRLNPTGEGQKGKNRRHRQGE